MKKEVFENNPILKLTLEFSLSVVEYCDLLQAERKFTISNQLFRCGTSIGANSFEAQNAESKADFIHKIKIAAKEADETQYWLMLCEFSSNYPDCKKLGVKLSEIQRIINSILGTAKRKNPLRFFLSLFL
ncbi:MAG: four helix bundle protein [Chitinophagaceae bacterium]